METNVFLTRENVTIHDFERVCRTCLSTVDLKPISDVFDSEHFPVEIALNKYTQIQFHLLDKLPKQICSNCVQNLNSSYTFLLNCDLVNTSLKKCLPPYEKNFPTNDCLPNAIEYVNCQIKQEPALFDSCELETNEYSIIPPLTKSENLHTTIDIKEESLDNLEYENDTDSCDADGEQIITHVKQNRKNTPETSTQFNIRSYKRSSDNDALPEKSRERYEVVYRRFMDWRLKKNMESFSETVMMEYFHELSDTMKPSSLWAIYSMLKATINMYHNHINIAVYPKLIALLKRKSDGFKSKKSKTLNTKEINDFLQNAPDNKYLLTKVVLIIGISGACRKQELRNIKPEHVQDTGKSLIINIPHSKTENKIHRSFIVSEAFYPTCKKYMNLRPRGNITKPLPFFLNYRFEKCNKKCVGVNQLGSIPKQIAEYLGLPDAKEYTGHCFRRSSATILVDAGGDWKSHSAWRASVFEK